MIACNEDVITVRNALYIFLPFLSPDVLLRLMMRWILLEQWKGRPVAGKTQI